MKYDLHLHTTASDGRLNPAALVELARARGLEVIAITDHDSVGGVSEALEEAGREPGIAVIPGVEINTDLASGELHVLGYFIDYRDADLALALQKIRESRVGRAQKMVEKLRELGMLIEWSRVQDMARGESICRPHIAQALLEKGFVASEREAFDKYIGRNGPAYFGRDKIQPADAVRIVKSAGGLPVLAHPAGIKDLNDLIIDLKSAGLVGLEAYYGEYDSNTVNRMVRLAGEHGLLTTGGADYHHFGDGREVPLGKVDVPEESIRGLFQAAGRMEELKKK
jgi:predicted metal-dependent phosphoesterase TrpH